MGKLMIRNADDSAWITIAGVGTVVQQDAAPANPHAGMMWLDTDATTGLQSEIRDADGDTKIVCEQSADEDTIRMYTLGQEHLQIWPGGEVSTPYQPVFLAYAAGQSNLTINTWHTITLTEINDIGGNFASNAFTAPVDGSYQLDFNLWVTQIPADFTNLWYQIVTDSRNYIYYLNPSDLGGDQAGTHVHRHIGIVVDLDAFDTAYVQVYQQAGTTELFDVNTNTKFSGFLVG